MGKKSIKSLPDMQSKAVRMSELDRLDGSVDAAEQTTPERLHQLQSMREEFGTKYPREVRI